jgi:homogentisate 1,2-dioxygenase
MNELMGLIHGVYDAKKTGFIPGGISIHNCMTAHGPDHLSYEHAALQPELKPEHTDSLAFMLETKEVWHVSDQALNHHCRQKEYAQCWDGFIDYFSSHQ